MNKCFNGKDHDFESNENSEYCSNGCGEKESVYLIKTLSNRVKELEGKLDNYERFLNEVASEDFRGNKPQSAVKARKFLEENK